MQKIIKIDTPSALSIVSEIHRNEEKLKRELVDMSNDFKKRQATMIEDHAKLAKENIERLRLCLSLPDLISPRLDPTYLEHNIAFLHHGPVMDKDSMSALLEKVLLGASEQ